MSQTLRNAITAALLVVAVIGVYVEYRAYQAGVPGHYTLYIAGYVLVAIYAIASLVIRARAGRDR